jgi:hypothetical protein
MAIKNLVKPTRQTPVKTPADTKSDKVDKFIAKGGTLTKAFDESNDDHRLTLRIPKWLMDKVDVKRKERIGKISRNLWILEILEQAAKEK